MKTYKIVMGVLSVALFASGSAEAGKRCGLGSKILGKQKGIISQVSEIITNQASSESNSISYGTSGCKHNGSLINPSIGMNNPAEEQIFEQKAYADANFEELKVEMAVGKGETLEGFASQFGCSEQAAPLFFRATQKGYESIIPANGANPDLMVDQVRHQIQVDPVLKQACTIS